MSKPPVVDVEDVVAFNSAIEAGEAVLRQLNPDLERLDEHAVQAARWLHVIRQSVLYDAQERLGELERRLMPLRRQRAAGDVRKFAARPDHDRSSR